MGDTFVLNKIRNQIDHFQIKSKYLNQVEASQEKMKYKAEWWLLHPVTNFDPHIFGLFSFPEEDYLYVFVILNA